MKVEMSRRLVLGAVFLLVVLGGRLLYMCEAKKDRPPIACKYTQPQRESTWSSRSSSETSLRSQSSSGSSLSSRSSSGSSWSRTDAGFVGCVPEESVKAFRDMGFNDSAARAMAAELEKDVQRRVRNASW